MACMDHAKSIMEGKPSVSYTEGSMSSLVDKLAKLKNPPLVIQALKQDLVSLQEDFFHKVSRRREANLQVEAWMKIVRELVFDIEDWVDQKPDMAGQQLDIEDEIKSFIALVEHARELCQRYGLIVEEPTDLHDPFAPVAVPSEAIVYSRVLSEEKTGLVGLEDQTHELVKLLGGDQKMVKVFSILGVEGLGKTTLANEVYAKLQLQGQFDCHAFVTLGRRPLSMRVILMDILHQVKSSHKIKAKAKTNIDHRDGRREAKHLQKVIIDLREFLCKKRYFILVDGLWSTRAWNIINCGLPNDNRGSRVLITTCISDVAKWCSVHPTDIYPMEALNKRMSGWLYQKITREDQWPNDYDEATKNMLKFCDGVPLAIIVTAGLLAMKSEEMTEANVFGSCILSSLEHHSTSEGMMKILHMSYAALSLPLKSCFLYLSVFREHYTIKKDRLIRLWIAEGFIPIEEKEVTGEETTIDEETIIETTTRNEEKRDEKTRGEETRCETRGEKATRHEESTKREVTGGEEITRVEETRADKTTRDEKRRVGETTRDEKATRREESTKREVTGGEEITRVEETRAEKTTRDEKRRVEETTRGEKTECEITTREEKREGESLWATGERYFNELITRRLLQPVFNYDDDQPMGCTVHGVVLDFINSMSRKGNFVTLGADLSSEGSTDTVRRFTLDCYNDENEDADGTLASIAVHLSRVRSITVLGGIEGIGGRSALTTSGKIEGKQPVLPCFRYIRVLDLEDTYNLRSHHLEGIGGLVLLKYLGVAGTDIDKLPEEIGELEKLETLDLRHTKLSTLPASIAMQKRLAHVLIDYTVRVPSEVLKMQGLDEISTIGVDSSSSIDSVVELLRKSERLRVLGVRLDGSHLFSDNKSVMSFVREIARSTKLTSLSLDCLHLDLLGLLLEFPPSDQFQRFKLTTSVPILKGTAHKMASLVSVTHMDIEIIQLDDHCVRVLEDLPNLVVFNLVSSGSNSRSRKSIKGPRKSTKDRCILHMGGFKRLKVFLFRCRSGGTELEFTQGAMRELRRLSLRFSARETLYLYGNFSFGIEHLSSLKLVNVTINCKSATASAVKNAEDEIRAQVGKFPVVPTKVVSRINQHRMLTDDKPKIIYPKIWLDGCIPNFKIVNHNTMLPKH